MNKMEMRFYFVFIVSC